MDLIIGDVHFGKYTNNITWLESQLDFFRTQIFGTILSEDISRVIFLGDIFDIRYSTNTQVGCEVKKLFRELVSLKSNIDIYIVAGNHDYYAPLEELKDFNVYEMLFGEEFSNTYKNIHFITKEPYINGSEAFLPWYSFNEENNLESILRKYPNINTIYTHTDLENVPSQFSIRLKPKTIFSGHIHYPFEIGNWHNLGACCSLDFSDSNTDRYIYLVDDNHKIYKKIKNYITPKFKRFFNEDIFTLTKSDVENSIVEIYINKDNQGKARYIEKIKEIKNVFVDYKIKFKPMDNNEQEKLDLMDMNMDIHTFIEKNIPDHLQNKYNNIKERINNK